MKEQTESDVAEITSSLRTARNYQLDLALHDKSLTGLKEECIFNKLSYFHVCDNFVFDVMHDILEGVLVYNLQHCLHYFIFIKQYLTVQDLNHRKNTFNFGNLNSSNLPGDFVESKVKNKQIRLTASEMKTFWKFLPLIIGSFVPENDPVWHFVKTALKLMHVALLVDVPIIFVEEFKNLVRDHHSQYLMLFDDTLKPKFHFLVHYSTAIHKCGSLRRNWAMRFEAKHREPKSYSRVNNNKKNLCYSLAVKAGFTFAYNIINNNFFLERISISDNLTVKKLPDSYAFCLRAMDGLIDVDSTTFPKHICKEGSVYTKGCTFILQLNNLINIYKCLDIVVDKQDSVYFFAQRYVAVNFNDHVQSYELNLRDQLLVLKDQPNVHSKPVNLHSFEDKIYLRLPNYYDCNADIVDTIIVNDEH